MKQNKIKEVCLACYYHKILNALVFAFLFTFSGWLIPQIFFNYFDTTVYYKIDNPVSVDKQSYYPCNTVYLSIHRISKMDNTIQAVLELVNKDNNLEVISITRELVTEKGEQTVLAPFGLPCILENGNYYIRGAVKYNIRNIDKSTKLYTVDFIVK